MRPGEELIQQGMQDLSQGHETIPALLVCIGAPRLHHLGFRIPDSIFASPEHKLYEKLRVANPDGSHSQYNALIRLLVSFERSVKCAM